MPTISIYLFNYKLSIMFYNKYHLYAWVALPERILTSFHLSMQTESPLDKHDMQCKLINFFIFYKLVRVHAHCMHVHAHVHGHVQIHAYEQPSTIGDKCLPLRDTLPQTYT